ERQVDVDAALSERQGRQEHDEQHEQHVDERRDVHLTGDFGCLRFDDVVSAVVLSPGHYCSPPSAAVVSVIRATVSICASLRASIISMMALYGASTSPLR